MTDAERIRLETDGRNWKRWGPYVSERAWGTVREDYSPHGTAWEYFPHDHARSRAYRWSEDGLAGISDEPQLLCLAFAFWNGRDPILKERIFGLTGNEGNHGEDAKEYWWYLDSTPTHSYMKWRYVYPQGEFPYAWLVQENLRRGRGDPEFELIDTGVFDEDRYWDITVEYAKASPDDVCARVTVRNAGPEEATLDVLPTLWFRNTWSWEPDAVKPTLMAKDGRVVVEGYRFGDRVLVGDGGLDLLFCENESNARRLWDSDGGTPHPKDGINDHVVHGLDTVNPDQAGTKASLRYRLTVAPGATTEIRLRLTDGEEDLGAGFEATFAARQREADEFYASLTHAGASPELAMVMRQAFAGMLWSKQLFHYDVEWWLEGDPTEPPPPPDRLTGRNSAWRHLSNHDVISMPDKWEYPWYAAWDLAFHTVALAHLDPKFAKDQLILLLREWYMHPNGQLPAYEWAFSDVNPPVHAWAALRVFEIDGSKDYEFLERVMHKLLLNFTWWVNRKDSEGNNVFEGGFLGLDNIGPIDRSAPLPAGIHLEQSDGTAWMAMYCLNLWEISLTLAHHDDTYEDLAVKFFEHFALIASAMYDQGLWDEGDGFYYDVLHLGGGELVPLRVRSMVGLLPLAATTTLGKATQERLPEFARLPVVPGEPAEVRGRGGPRERPGEGRGPSVLHRRPGPAPPDPGRDAGRGRVPLASRPQGAVPPPRGASVRAADRRQRGPGGLRAGRVDHGAVRGEFELAGPDLVPRELPGDRGPQGLPPVPGGRMDDRASHGQWAAPHPERGRRRACLPAGLPVPRRRGGPPAGVRPVRKVPAGSGLARHDPVPRVLPRRHRAGPGGLPPDRVDGPGRRPDRATH